MVDFPVYRIKLHKDVIAEDSRHFDANTKQKIKKKCKELLRYHPDRAGESLQRELSGYRKLKVFSDYRVVYRVNPKERIVYILAIGIRRGEEVYQEAVKRVRS